MSSQTNIFQLLKTHWGFDSFREPQQEIIETILEGKDVLALLPTGGGKSICFQIPALAKDGICIVVSPLIALMKDQVENLNKRGIKAYAIYSGLHRNDLATIYDNCLYGGVKFLYLSPERLGNLEVQDFLTQLNINLLAIDEAHCISQWGHEFRPSYRKIAGIREMMPAVPVMALTASATPKVANDIMGQLGFKKPLLIQKSFERKNLHYVVRKTEDKIGKLIQSVEAVNGSGLVYVRNRKKTEEIAALLNQHKLNASFYHAGLISSERNKRQEDWIKGKVRIMVCTNAFGMGIDKPDCRWVIHFEMPDCLEAYYQEAGRAGRDGNKAHCLLLFNPTDAEQARVKLEQQYPEPDFLRNIYEQLGSHFQLALGTASDLFYPFDLIGFSKHLKLNPVKVNAAISLLSQLELIQLSEGFEQRDKLKICVQPEAIKTLEKQNEKWFNILQMMLRLQGGLFDEAKIMSIDLLAQKVNLSENGLRAELVKMAELGIIEFYPSERDQAIQMVGERLNKRYIKLDARKMLERKQTEIEKLEAMIAFANNTLLCRSRNLLHYFGEKDAINCGNCDICMQNKAKGLDSKKLELICGKLFSIQWEKPIGIKELVPMLKGVKPEEIVEACRYLSDKGILEITKEQEIYWNGKKS